jgi:hypothetical protein
MAREAVAVVAEAAALLPTREMDRPDYMAAVAPEVLD